MTLDPTWFDLFLALLLGGFLPLKGIRSYRKLHRRLAEGDPEARVRSYRQALLSLWTLTALMLVAWFSLSREAAMLGLEAPEGLVSWGVLAAAVSLAALQLSMVARLGSDPDELDSVRKQMAALRPLLPSSDREFRWFMGLGVTAGITEELLFRGFLISYLSVWIGVWPAVVVSSVMFGFGHLYQGGAASVLKTGIVGLFLAVIFVVSGQLWAPMVLHVTIDLTSGWAARKAQQEA